MKRLERVSRRNLVLRRCASLVCVLALLGTTLGSVPLNPVRAFDEPTQHLIQRPSSSKRPITHQDYDSWRSIQASQISRDGKYVAYAFMQQDGDSEIVVRNVASGVEWRAPRGFRPPVPPPDDPSVNIAELLATQARLVRPVFTADSRFIVFGIEPTKADLNKARKEKKKPEDMPKNALGIMDISSGAVTRVEKVKNFQVPEDGSGFIAYLLEPLPEKKPDPSASRKPEAPKPEPSPTEGSVAEPVESREKPSPTPSGSPALAAASATQPGETSLQPQSSLAGGASAADRKKKEYGSELVLRNMTNMNERKFADVLDYTLSKDAKTVVYAVSARKEDANGVYAVATQSDGPPQLLVSGKGKYQKLTWDEEQTQLAFLSDKEDASAKQPRSRVYHWSRNTSPAAEVVSNATAGFRKDLVVSDKANLSFSLDGSRLFIGASPPPEPEKNPDEEPPADERVLVDLWHWKDDYVQPIQKIRAEQERNKSYRAVYHVKEKAFVQLADETMENIAPSNDGRYAIGTDNRQFRTMSDHDPGYSDYYLVNTLTGARKLIGSKQRFGVSLSPNAKYAIYFDGKDWNSYSIPDGKVVNLTRNLGTKFFDEDNDTPSVPGSYGVTGWTKDDAHVLLNDRFDVWQVAPDGSAAKILTDGLGRKDKTVLRYVRLDPKERWIDPAKPMLLRAVNEETRDSGFYRDKIGSGVPEKLVMAAKDFNSPTKARDAEVLVLSASRVDEFPDLLITSPSFKEFKKISNGDVQRAQFIWPTAELVRFKSVDGVPLKGLLFKPENFDPKRKYPMIVNIYEKLSQGLHNFRNPGPGTSINATYYASNGYLVFMPDIVYDIGYPGPSALKCVLPGIQAVVDKGFVDEKAIGIQGHSWGGYQIAYMVTQTNRFRAAAPGAVVANMTSAYSGIRWGTGLPRQFQYEHSQSRIGGTLWEYPMRFLENSPVFRADRVETPMIMIHNDDDDAVPWYQGIEYYLALRRLNKEAYLFNYNGEKHNLRKRINQKDYTRRVQEFFDHFLKGAPAPEWMQKGIPYLKREQEKERYRLADQK
ncbi:MAG TPA: prolyl oligopeptidase family serine peptidase [Pyrinomonadaceae bacterium]|nr:prolyl oligopeptidase family serine peptidase [Pyrinomonadaceae bacterium]